jgi:hypothetical protein
MFGDKLASNLATRLLADEMPLDLDAGSQTSAEVETLANTTPGGDLYWVPSGSNIMDSYGLLLATLVEDEKAERNLDTNVAAALNRYIDAAKQKTPRKNKSLMEDLKKQIVDKHEPSKREANSVIRSTAIALRDRLRPAAKDDQLLNDLRLYLALADIDDQPTTELQGLNGWLRGANDPMEMIASGELEISVFPVDQQGVKQSTVIRAQIFGRHSRLFRIVRPAWFHAIHIESAKARSKTSNSFARFFGANGALSSIPIAVFAMKEIEYWIELSPADAGHMEDVLNKPGTTVTVQYPGGRIIAPAASVERLKDTTLWRLTPKAGRARAVALVSQLY